MQWYHGRNNESTDKAKPPAMLRVGEPVTEHTKVVKADPKVNVAGEEMIVAGVKKYYETHEGGIALTDQRCAIIALLQVPSAKYRKRELMRARESAQGMDLPARAAPT